MIDKQTILTKISTEKALLEAWKLLNKANKTSKGLSNISIKDFEGNLKVHIAEISKSLLSKTYKFSKVKGVTILKKDGKPRPLRVPEIKDRLVHKVLAIAFEKLLTPKYELNNKCSFAYQSGKGIIDAIAQMIIYYREGYRIILEADIVRFFPSVDSVSLIEKIKRALPDDSVNDLFEKAMNQELGNIAELKNRKVYEEHFLSSELGIPQGNALSPLLANICLSEFDQRMIKENIRMVRYADDFIILCKDKNEANKAYQIALEELEEKLKLKVYPLESTENVSAKCSRIIDPRGVRFSFLSVQFDGVRCWVSQTKFDSLIEKLKDICKKEEGINGFQEEIGLLQSLIKMKNLLEGWIAAYYFLDIGKQVEEIDKHVNIELYNLFECFNFSLKADGIQKITLKDRSNTKRGLSDVQRKFVGVPLCKSTLEKIRSKKDSLETLIQTKRIIFERDLIN